MQSLSLQEPAHGPPDMWTVDQITRAIKETLEQSFKNVWVEGEVVNLRPASSGHLYFSLDGNNAILSAALFRNDARRIGIKLREGEKVACYGSIDLWPKSGRYQLIVRGIRRSGEGERLAALEALKKKLHSEGLFAAERKRPLPFLPRRIGVITSPTGAAIRDIVRSIHQRFEVPILLAPSAVQGEHAPQQLVDALTTLQTVTDVDVIILGRGGGSLDDLWAFNDEALARAVAACPKPVVSAVGHEVDTMLTDFVADARAATPTHAGALVVPIRSDLVSHFEAMSDRARRGLLTTAQRARDRLLHLGRRLPDADRLVRYRWQRLDELDRRIVRSVQGRTEVAALALKAAELRLSGHHPIVRLRREKELAFALQQRLERAWSREHDRYSAMLTRFEAGLRALGPTSALRRGYAIVRKKADSKVVRSHADVDNNEYVEILLCDGAVDAQVTGVRPGGTSL